MHSVRTDFSEERNEGGFVYAVQEQLRHGPLARFDLGALDPAGLVALARQLGAIRPHPSGRFGHPQQPEIFVLSNYSGEGALQGGCAVQRGWHTDLAYTPDPAAYTLLYCVTAPKARGQTLVVDLRAVCARLPESLRQRVSSLFAEHRYVVTETKGAPPLTPCPVTNHPVLCIDPATGRSTLYVSPGFTTRILGIEAEESSRLLQALWECSTADEHVVCHTWKPGQLMVLDNQFSMHRACPCAPDDPRVLYRVMVGACTPTRFPADQPPGVATS